MPHCGNTYKGTKRKIFHWGKLTFQSFSPFSLWKETWQVQSDMLLEDLRVINADANIRENIDVSFKTPNPTPKV